MPPWGSPLRLTFCRYNSNRERLELGCRLLVVGRISRPIERADGGCVEFLDIANCRMHTHVFANAVEERRRVFVRSSVGIGKELVGQRYDRCLKPLIAEFLAQPLKPFRSPTQLIGGERRLYLEPTEHRAPTDF